MSNDKLDIDALLADSARVAAEFDAEENKVEDWESNQADLQDRQALRRVAGLSTELQDVSDAEYRQLRLEKVVLVGVWVEGTSQDAENSLKELSALAETAGSEVMAGLIQRRDKPDPATFIGSGKVLELREAVVNSGADTVVCDGELSPAQLRNLEGKVKVKVIDRTALILDIFAQHAKSREGKAQVELAQMTYLLPRLRGWGDSQVPAEPSFLATGILPSSPCSVFNGLFLRHGTVFHSNNLGVANGCLRGFAFKYSLIY